MPILAASRIGDIAVGHTDSKPREGSVPPAQTATMNMSNSVLASTMPQTSKSSAMPTEVNIILHT